MGMLPKGIPLVRYQDADGRGPFKPGVTEKWSTEGHLPAIHEELGIVEMMALIDLAKGVGLKHFGCAVTPIQLQEWFSPHEQVRLAHLGYWVADATSCKIIATGKNQFLIASEKHLKELPKWVDRR